jgi:cytochrome c oxidase assembly protein subunit 15
MFLGTQVREYIDELTKSGYGRESWSNLLGISFFIHRSFSWLVLALLTVLAIYNEKNNKYLTLRWIYGLLAVELISGVLLAHADLPGLARTAHLVLASCLFGILTMVVYRLSLAK